MSRLILRGSATGFAAILCLLVLLIATGQLMITRPHPTIATRPSSDHGGHCTVLHDQALMEGQVSISWLYNTVLTVDIRYKRVFCVGKQGIATLNPGSGEVTNQVS